MLHSARSDTRNSTRLATSAGTPLTTVTANSRLTIAAHVLVWMGLNQRLGAELSTSEQIAGSVNTNPVVIRRLVSQLRDAGLVEPNQACPVGAGIRPAMERVYGGVEDAVSRELAATTLAEVSQDVLAG